MPLFTILTLFPDALEPYLECGVVGIAREKGLCDVRLVDFRDFSADRHRTVDDRPFGGGPGMVLRPEPIVAAVEWVEEHWGPHRKIALCPGGDLFRQRTARELAGQQRVLLLCGRYEGFDERIFEVLELESLSIGNFVLAGGELAALCVLEASVRLLPGALGNERSAAEDSFATETEGEDDLLDCPQYTRPRSFRGRAVPEVLLGGDHGAIRAWRETKARERTRVRRESIARSAGLPGEDTATEED